MKVYNIERLAKLQGKPIVIFSNHNSRFDSYALASVIPFSYKSFWSNHAHITTERWNLFRIAGELLDLYFLHDKNNIRETAQEFRNATCYVKKGGALALFPEGAFTLDQPVGPFGPACSKLAIDAKATVVPVVVTGTNNMFENSRDRKPMMCEIHICEPVTMSTYSRKDSSRISEEIRTIIESKYLEITQITQIFHRPL